MNDILITNAWSWYNKGDAAIVITMIESLRKNFPNAKICILSYTPVIDNLMYKKYQVKVLKGLRFMEDNKDSKFMKSLKKLTQILRHIIWAVLYKIIKRDVKFLKRNEAKILDEYRDADIIISCGGEVIWGDLSYIFLNLYEIFLGKILGKPIVIYSQSFGPFNSKISESLARFLLNRADLITVREEISLNYLKRIQINRPPIYLTADSAFLIDPIIEKNVISLLSKEDINLDNRPIFGFTLRRWTFPGSINPKERYDNYIKVMAKVVDHIIDSFDSIVIFIPQVIVPNSREEDDRIVAKDVHNLVKNKNKFKILTNDYSPQELKAIIGQMDLFIGTRMHSNIFSTSMGVPVIAVGYRHKTEGIMKMLGQEKLVCNIGNLKFKDVIKKIEIAWINKEKIKSDLKIKTKIIQKRALYNAELVKYYWGKGYEKSRL